MITFKLFEGNLIIEDDSIGKILWQGQPRGCSVVKIMPFLENTEIVLLDYYEFSKSESHGLSNLLLYGIDGQIKWTAELPESKDSYVDFDLMNESIIANSWSGMRVQINHLNGKILKMTFTK